MGSVVFSVLVEMNNTRWVLLVTQCCSPTHRLEKNTRRRRGGGEIEDWFKQKQSSGSRRWRRKKLWMSRLGTNSKKKMHLSFGLLPYCFSASLHVGHQMIYVSYSLFLSSPLIIDNWSVGQARHYTSASIYIQYIKVWRQPLCGGRVVGNCTADCWLHTVYC